MSENPIKLGFEIKRSIDTNSFREKSKDTAKKIREANPHSIDKSYMLKQGIIDGEISIGDALDVARDTGLIRFEDPKDDRIGDSGVEDNLRLFLFNQGNALSMPNKGENEAFYIFDAVVRGTTRLPVVIEGVRQTLIRFEGNLSRNKKEPQDWQKRKIDRLSSFLFELTDFQTDLITDEIVKETQGDWNETRKSVVDWSDIKTQLSEMSDKNVKLRSIIESASTKIASGERWHKDDEIETSQDGLITPIDSMQKRQSVRT